MSKHTHSAFLCTLIFSAFLLFSPVRLDASPDSIHYNPFETRDQNLFNLIHGQPLPTNAHLNQKAQSLWSSNLTITNELNIESNDTENLLVDYEAYRFNLSYQYGINEDWNLKLDVPVIHQGSGLFDSAIDSWHRFFGLPRGERPSVADNEYRIQYSNKNQDLINLDETSTSLGDIQIAAARSVLKNNRTTMSLWGSVKLPTGDKSKLSGNGATDFSTWLALNQQFTNSWLMNINAGTVFLGSDNFQNIPLSDHVYYGHIMLGWLASEFFDLKVQLQGHTSYYRKTRLRAIGDTYFMTFGTSIKINQCNRLDIAVSEDIKVNASPDVSLLINWRSYSAGC